MLKKKRKVKGVLKHVNRQGGNGGQKKKKKKRWSMEEAIREEKRGKGEKGERGWGGGGREREEVR